MPKSLITGIFGQDGSYLCELLHEKGYEVHGIIRKQLGSNSVKIKQYLESKNIKPAIHEVDLNNYNNLKDVITKIKPDEIYHTAAFHVSSEGFSESKYFLEKQLFDYNIKSTSNILSICFDFVQDAKIVTAGSCLMFDASKTNMQNENTLFESESLYGLAKITENSLVKYYRNNGLNCSTAILYNHESSRRSDNFVTKKIVKNMTAIKKGEIKRFTLGNIDTNKDWGYAKDYAYGMYLMAKEKKHNDYILSSGKLHSVKDFINICSEILGIKNSLECIDIDEKIIDRKFKGVLLGDFSKARKILKWEHSVNLYEMIETMIKNEYDNTLI